MNLEGLEERRAKKVDPSHIKKARNNNITILRTIDLLGLTLSTEARSITDRKKILLDLIGGGGGMIYADDKEFKLVTE